MRLNVTQVSPLGHPYVHVNFQNTDIYENVDSGYGTARLIEVTADEQPWGGQYHIVIDNDDGLLDTKDYRGWWVVLMFGFEEGDNT